MRRTTVTKYTDRKVKTTALHQPLELASRELLTHSEHKRKLSPNSTSQEFEDASSKPDAKRLKTEPEASSEGESPAPARSGESDQLRVKAQPSVSCRKPIEEHDGIPSQLYTTLDPKPSSVGGPSHSQVHGDRVRPEAHAPGPCHFPETVEGDSMIPAVGATIHDGVDFGLLECIGDYVPPYRLRAPSKQSEWTELMVGCDSSCDVTVIGHDVGRRHCLLLLELRQPEDRAFRRRLWVKRTDLDRPVYRTSVQKNSVPETLRECTTLADGDRVQFGDGYWYKYRAPKWSNLYQIQDKVYGNLQTNCSVSRVKRLSDEHPFLAKTILKTEIDMAKTEIEVFKTVGYHPNVTRFIEVFLDPSELSHHMILEVAKENLYDFVERLRPRRERALRAKAGRMTVQISNAICHIHSYDIAHRDLKPQNILVFPNGSRNLDVKICDFGLASLSSEPISPDGWEATPYWMPPGSFTKHTEGGKLADCYAIGRILYFILTSSPWPMESRDTNARCGCDVVCPESCEGRKMALDVLLNAGAGGRCVDLLRNLLVAYPEECMDILEIFKHPYILNADPGPTTK